MDQDLKISLASKEHCPQILGIYEHYVRHTAISFEYDVPTLEEMEARMENIQRKYPYLVAETGGNVAGYAYATDFRYRAAYQWSPESAIYVHKDFHGRGIGRQLYNRLFEILKLQGFHNVFAGVALPNDASISLHLRCGFEEIGVYKNIGYKFGKWHTTQWFQLELIAPETNPAPPKPVSEVIGGL